MAGILRVMTVHDRMAARREDHEWLDTAWTSPEARTLVFSGAKVHVAEGKADWIAPSDAPVGLRIFLGVSHDGPRFALLRTERASGDEWQGLRQLLPTLGGSDTALIVHAFGLAEWHKATKHCPACGGELTSIKAGHELRCSSCERVQFPRTDSAVIMLITDEQDRALLGRQPSWPKQFWSTLAGFVEPGESFEDAVRREIQEESGVRVGDVRYFGSQPWPLPASIMVGFRGSAVSTEITVDAELDDAAWFSREAVEAGAADGSILVPPTTSISGQLIRDWFGRDLPGTWR